MSLIIDKTQRARIAEIVSEESPLFGMYTGDSTTEDFLNRDVQTSNTPNFGDSLRVYHISSGLDNMEIEKRAGIPIETNLITKLMNHSSTPSYRGRLPSISSNHFFRLGLSRKKGEDHGRIPMLLYDKNGLLMLRKGAGESSAVDEAIRYLSEKGNMNAHELWRRNYLNDILAESAGCDKGLDFSKREVKMKRIIRTIEETMGLVPVYLVPCLPKEELEEKKYLISEHIQMLVDYPTY